MKVMKFGGYSDDTFGEVTPAGDDYDNCASGRPIRWLISSDAEGASLIVVGQYGQIEGSGGWLVGVCSHDPLGDDIPIPAWPMRFEPPCGHGARPYTPVLIIEAPDDARLTCMEREE